MKGKEEKGERREMKRSKEDSNKGKKEKSIPTSFPEFTAPVLFMLDSTFENCQVQGSFRRNAKECGFLSFICRNVYE